jgi:FtsZ-binding cell division protein ZapB
MDTAEKNKAQNPVAYSEARTNYYTLLKGQGWLVAEKQKVAQEEIEPILGRYASAYKVLEAKDKSQYHFKNLASAVKSHEEDNALLSKEVQKVHDKTNVLKREAEMSTAPTTNFGSYLPWILDGIIALLGLAIVYMIYRRFTYVPTVVEQVEQVLGGRNKSR